MREGSEALRDGAGDAPRRARGICESRVLALEPRVNLPEPRIAVARPPLRDRHRDLERKERRELRQPVELHAAWLGRPAAAGEAHAELVAEPEDRVDGAARFDPPQRQSGPFGELLGQESPDECLVELELVLVHLHHRPIRRIGGSPATGR